MATVQSDWNYCKYESSCISSTLHVSAAVSLANSKINGILNSQSGVDAA